MNETQRQQLGSFGIDWNKIDWAKVQELMALLVQFFTDQHPKQMASAVGCDEGSCSLMHEAICNNLKAAHLCLQCCCEKES